MLYFGYIFNIFSILFLYPVKKSIKCCIYLFIVEIEPSLSFIWRLKEVRSDLQSLRLI